ncbi:MAG: Gfo/Idh/MocA family protein [Terriglobales bacterium]
MTIHIGLAGGGNISGTQPRAVRSIPGAEIVAIHGSNANKVAALCREYGGKGYQDFDAFLAHRPMEMVAIGSPSGMHAAQGIAAARGGLHVLTEKPIDISAERADALIETADAAGVKLGVMFQDRVKPGIRELRQWLVTGVIGRPLLVDARVKWHRPPEYYSGSRWRGSLALDGGGALINQAVHTVDLLLWLFGDVLQVRSQTATVLHPIETEDTAIAILEFASGALGVLLATTAAHPGYPRRVEISGTEGTVILEQDRIVAANLRNPAVASSVPAGDENQSASSAVVDDIRGHRALFEDFIGAIERDTTPICDGREGRRSIALVEAIYRAARHGGTVPVSLQEP